jgi:hypothetical protein
MLVLSQSGNPSCNSQPMFAAAYSMSRNRFSEYEIHHTALEFQGRANTILNDTTSVSDLFASEGYLVTPQIYEHCEMRWSLVMGVGCVVWEEVWEEEMEERIRENVMRKT